MGFESRYCERRIEGADEKVVDMIILKFSLERKECQFERKQRAESFVTNQKAIKNMIIIHYIKIKNL